jgi:hypothetical protein
MATAEPTTQKKTKAVAKAAATQAPASLAGMDESALEAWTDSQADTTEILIPKVILMQATSTLVAEGDCAAGDLVRSTDKAILGNAKNPVGIVPISYTRTWVESKYDGNMYKWNHEHPFTAANADLEWKYVDDEGVQWERKKAYNFFVVLADNPDSTQLPIIKLQFKSGSIKVGKQLADFFARLPVINQTRKARGQSALFPASFIWDLSSVVVKGDAAAYQTFALKQGEETSPELLDVAVNWYMTLNSAKTVVKTDDVEEDVPF